MRIRTTINHSYPLLAARRKKRFVVVVRMALACAALTCIAIESGMPMGGGSMAVEANAAMPVRHNDLQTASLLASGRDTNRAVDRAETVLRNRSQ